MVRPDPGRIDAVKALALYTLARLALFGVAFVVVWLVASRWLDWNQITVLWTALIALVISAIASWLLLGRLRDAVATEVEGRAKRVAAAYDASRRAEDD
jgi:hypothetical protein